jgi:hypothetical protein
MKKLILLVITFIIIGFQLSAQKTKDVLYLKNGSMVYGKLIEIIDDQYKIQTSDGSVFIYKSEEVEKFAKVSPTFDGRKTDGFIFSLEAGLLVGAQDSRYEAPFSFNILAGSTFKTVNSLSFGSGIEYFGRPFTPLFIEYKHIIYDRKTSPFVFARGGGVIPFGADEQTSSVVYSYDTGPKDYKGGASFTFGTGISWAKEDHETYLSFGYRYVKTSFKQYEYNRGEVTYNNSLNRLEIKFGYKF